MVSVPASLLGGRGAGWLAAQDGPPSLARGGAKHLERATRSPVEVTSAVFLRDDRRLLHILVSHELGTALVALGATTGLGGLGLVQLIWLCPRPWGSLPAQPG